MRPYVALIQKDADSAYGVSFPDLPGGLSAGTTLEEARLMAQDALALRLEGLAEDGEPLPAASALEEIMAERENRDGVAILVDPPRTTSRAVRVQITLPEDVLSEIDRFAEANGMTRSGFLARAAKRELAA